MCDREKNSRTSGHLNVQCLRQLNAYSREGQKQAVGIEESGRTDDNHTGTITDSQQQSSGGSSDDSCCARWESCESNGAAELKEALDTILQCPCKLEYQQRDNGVHVGVPSYTQHDLDLQTIDECPAHRHGASYCFATAVKSRQRYARQCCYDGSLKLITSGSGMGTALRYKDEYHGQPMHCQIDLLPQLMCGDETFYKHRAQPPFGSCVANPTPQVAWPRPAIPALAQIQCDAAEAPTCDIGFGFASLCKLVFATLQCTSSLDFNRLFVVAFYKVGCFPKGSLLFKTKAVAHTVESVMASI